MGNGRQNHKFDSQKIKVVYFCIVLVLVLMEYMWVEIGKGGGGVGG